ncbi:MAG: hypothetical protein ABIP95_05485 [Pelobium sp.]
MKKLTLLILCVFLVLSLKAQTQEEIAKAQQEYMKQMSSLMNCDTLAKILKTNYDAIDKSQLTKEQLAELKSSIDEQLKNCKEYLKMAGGYSSALGSSKEKAGTEGNSFHMPKMGKAPFESMEIPNAYQISYTIKDGDDVVNMDLFLSATTSNYAYVSKDPETGEKAYSIFKEDNKMIYVIAQNYIMGYDFGKFQQSGQNLTPSKEALSKYQLKPTGQTQTVAGYLCKELVGKTDDGGTLKLYVSYAIKSGSNVMPGARYKESEKAFYQKFYGSGELGMFLKAVTIDKDGTTTITATKVQKNPPKKVIDTKNYEYMNASEMMNIQKPKN